MKMSTEHYVELKNCIATVIGQAPAHKEFLIKEDRAKDIDMRLRWDLMWASTTHDWRRYAYQDLNDSHIDTALRSIMKELNNA